MKRNRVNKTEKRPPFPDSLFIHFRSFLTKGRLTLSDSVVRTNLSAAAAADASVGIDVIDITFRDCVHRANRHASAACDTVVANYVCHSCSNF